MKKGIFFFIAACIAGFACFAVSFWLFKRNFDHALELSIILGISWLTIQYIREYVEKRKKNKIIK